MLINININGQMVFDSIQKSTVKRVGIDIASEISRQEIKRILETYSSLKNIQVKAEEEKNVPQVNPIPLKVKFPHETQSTVYDECPLCNHITLIVESDNCMNCGAVFIRDSV